ncbi:hypothetical protein BH09BAC3_BH09BAC3_05520 [soil metagenome]
MDKSSIFFSIVIPTYNRADFIVATIKSLLAQRFRDFEIIVVDDGSTDNTAEVVKQMTDERIQYYTKQNSERAAARNFGARLAKGTYINFFDSDDTAYPEHLSKAKEVACSNHHPEIFHLGFDIKNDDGVIEEVRDNFHATINNDLINGNHLSCNGVFMRNDIVSQFPFNEDRVLSASEDYELWLRLAARFPFYCDNTVTSTIVNHSQRSVVQTNQEPLIKRMDALWGHLLKDQSFVKAYGGALHSFKAYLNVYVALHLAIAKASPIKSMTYLFDAVRIKPSVLFSKRFLGALKSVIL